MKTKSLRTDAGATFGVDERFLSVSEVSRVFGVADVTIKSWVDLGRLLAARTVGGHRRIATSSVISLLKEQGRAVPRELVLTKASVLFLGRDATLTRSLRRVLTDRAELHAMGDLYAGLLMLQRLRLRVFVFETDCVSDPAALVEAVRADEGTTTTQIIAACPQTRSTSVAKLARRGDLEVLRRDEPESVAEAAASTLD